MKIILIENTWLDRTIIDCGWGNGYIAIPEGHFLFGMSYEKIHEKFNINVNGGLTFSGRFESLNESAQKQYPELKGHWVIGFDTCHSFDDLKRWPKENVLFETERLLKQFSEIIEPIETIAGIKSLIGKTLQSVTVNDDKTEIIFITDKNIKYKMYHDQNCCESVEVDDIIGDLDDLIGVPIMKAEEVESDGENPPNVPVKEYQDSFTWTFYHLATIKGYVTIRWYGESNGYYSESVSFEKI